MKTKLLFLATMLIFALFQNDTKAQKSKDVKSIKVGVKNHEYLDANSQVKYYSFHGNKGDLVFIKIDGLRNFQPHFKLYDDNFNFISTLEYNGLNWNIPVFKFGFIEKYSLKYTGKYHIKLDNFDQNSGSFTIEIKKKKDLVKPVQFGVKLNKTLDAAFPDIYSLSLNKGDKIIIKVSDFSVEPFLYLIDDILEKKTHNVVSDELTADRTSKYRIEVWPQHEKGGLGMYSIKIQRKY